ncbi:hypothetical protein NBH00_23680 [Paraconexibacter antarcticus]|uniref:Uncharacterized protein n=1 Tax=Paraconexibacter antarcticus TaxID=2949664 RepID=A0ABY5DQL5_9ACTN|nr:hypothetical protein [Paraconexibacter antarcticus]UTI64326.1 hypothetical protein NBH00_23680 [Paraconexibacter antarcticus]
MNRFVGAMVQAGVPPHPKSLAPVRTAGNRVFQGLVLTGGAATLAATAGADRIPFYWTPLILGVTYLLAATIDGPRGGYWATALGLTGWGLAVAYMGEIRPAEIDTAGAYLVGAGLAGVVAAALRTRGFLISETGLAATVALGGLTLALTPRAPDTLDDATTYAIALAFVGAGNLFGGAFGLWRARDDAARPA